jgi:protein SCO1
MTMVCAAAAVQAAGAPELKAGVFEPPQPAPDLVALKATDGGELTLARYRGKVVALVFGYTQCPAVCPTTLATLAEARRGLGGEAGAVQVVYVTVDPERDALPAMNAYLTAFDKTFIGATGTPAALSDVYKRYGVTAVKVPMAGGGYGMNHSSSVYLIDREGRLRALMPYGHEAKDFVHDFRRLLAAR